jgi:hypothetical protein
VQPVIVQLEEIADLLRADGAPTRGVALAELLLCSPDSALYGSQPDRLRREPGRVRYLLDP